MSEAYIGEIRIFAGNFPPKGWAFCSGQLLPIVRNTALFSILGVTYGGDGKTTFALPNLQGRAPMQPGHGPGLTDRVLGEMDGSQTVTLLTNEMPMHNHVPMGNGTAGSAATGAATDNVWGSGGRSSPAAYTNAQSRVTMNPLALAPTGGSQPHNNMQPYLGVNFIIALEGVFPQRP